MKLKPEVPLVQYFCHPCGHNFIDEDLTRKRYAVHASMLHHERLSDETTRAGLTICGQANVLPATIADLKARFSYVGLHAHT